MKSLSTIDEVQHLWKTLTEAEQEQVNHLLPVVSDMLRQEAYNVDRDLDEMIDSGKVLPSVVSSVVVDIVRRYMNTIKDDSAPTTQFAQAALGYSTSGTYLVPGGGIFIKKAELSRLGLRRQRVGGVDLD